MLLGEGVCDLLGTPPLPQPALDEIAQHRVTGEATHLRTCPAGHREPMRGMRPITVVFVAIAAGLTALVTVEGERPSSQLIARGR